MLLECSVATEYVDAVLLDERESLEDPVIYQFMQHYYPKVWFRCRWRSVVSAHGLRMYEFIHEVFIVKSIIVF